MAVFFGILGLLFGSFANAVVWRIHEHKSIVNERSECPRCHHKLGVLDLVPVFSWLALGGRCRYCHKPISIQYPLVELLTAALFAVSYLRLTPIDWPSWLSLIVWLYVLTSLIILSVYDWRWMLLPDVVLLPALVTALTPVMVSFVTGQPMQVWLGPITAALGVGAVFYALASVAGGRLMGGGDIKLVALIGLLLGLRLTAVALFIGFDVAAIVSLVLLALKLKKRTDQIPFGPFLALGCVVAMLWGQPILNWYLTRLG